MTRLDIAYRMKAHMAGRVKQALARLKNKSNDDNEESSGDKPSGDKSSGNKRKRQGGKDRSNKRGRSNIDRPCPFHGGHTWRDCFGNPSKKNDSYKEGACRKLLGQDDIKKKFPWFVKACERERGLTLENGVIKKRGNNRQGGDRRRGGDRDRRSRDQNDRDGEERTEPAQQQFQFAPPAGLPPLPVGSTIQIILLPQPQAPGQELAPQPPRSAQRPGHRRLARQHSNHRRTPPQPRSQGDHHHEYRSSRPTKHS